MRVVLSTRPDGSVDVWVKMRSSRHGDIERWVCRVTAPHITKVDDVVELARQAAESAALRRSAARAGG
jgi:hypothetical protein